MGYRRLPDEGPLPPIRIFDVPCRLWHWSNAVLMIGLIVSGYLIGTPLPSNAGDPSSQYAMGWLRFVHLACGQVFALAFLFRVYWAVMGNRYSWQLFLPAVWRQSWVEGLKTQLLWNVAFRGQAVRYVGLNPLANLAMLFLFVLPSAITILTGFAMLAEVTGHESWQYALFGWMVSLFGNTMDLHVIHRLCMWVLIAFTVAHIYMAVREDVMARQTMISSMLSGRRMYR